MSRRTFLCWLTLGTVAPALAEAQPASNVRRIGWFWDGSAGPPPPDWPEAFRKALQELGWVEGHNLVIEVRSPEQRALTVEQRDDALKRKAAELLALGVDVIVANPAGATLAAKKVTETVPIVFAGVSDPVGFGLVTSCRILFVLMDAKQP